VSISDRPEAVADLLALAGDLARLDVAINLLRQTPTNELVSAEDYGRLLSGPEAWRDRLAERVAAGVGEPGEEDEEGD
jgi:hypothetical protein